PRRSLCTFPTRRSSDLAALFPDVVHDGSVDRARLSAVLVAAPDRLREIEAIVHPLVRAEVRNFFAVAEAKGHWAAVADIPLLYEDRKSTRLNSSHVKIS